MARSPLHQLTRLEILNAKPASKPFTLSDGGRLYVLVKSDGAKLWRWNYDFAGKTRTMALGCWPEVSEKEARAAHAAGRELLRQGVDPMQQRREANLRARFQTGATFESVAKSWINALVRGTHSQAGIFFSLYAITVVLARWLLARIVISVTASSLVLDSDDARLPAG